MGEKKEKQWAVVKMHRVAHFIDKIIWFDARKDAREYASTANAKSAAYHYGVYSMTRGPHA